jgi:hypothetical protein
MTVPQLVIDDFANATLWAAFDPASAPSAEIVLAADTVHRGYLPDATSLRLETSSSALGHFVTRTLGPLDMSNFSELRFWYRATRPADGTPLRPFQLRLQLGSVALPIGAPGNDWHRYLPAAPASGWQFVRVALDDLNPLVAGAVTAVRFTCVDATVPFTTWLDDLIACRPEIIADVDDALLGLLNGVLNIGGPVPARVHVDGATPPPVPWLRLIHYEAAYSDIRTTSRRPRTDFTDTGYRVRPEAVAYDLYYRVEAATSDRVQQTTMLEFVMDTLGHRRTLLVNGTPLPLDRVPDLPVVDDLPTLLSLRYRVATLQERGPQQHVLPVLEPRLAVDMLP